jgi:hypothetical protein
MRKLIILFIFILCSWVMNGQSTTVATSGGKILLYGSNQYGKQVGYFMFDSTAGTFVRSGNQVNLFRSYMKYNNALQRRLSLAENIIQYIEKDGSIRYPIEFKAAVALWMKENQQY